MNINECVSEKVEKEYFNKYKECMDIDSRVVYWDKLDEFLKDCKMFYQIGMKVAKEEFDFELEDECEEIKKRYKEIKERKNYKENKGNIEMIIMNIMHICCDCIICIRSIREYGIKEED